MQNDDCIVPVVLFAYARPRHLEQTLLSLRANHPPLIYAFSDGPKGDEDLESVCAVRRLLREIDWCEVVLVERAENVGLGPSILQGVGEVARQHGAFLVVEDDLVLVPGAYCYLRSALLHYWDDRKVMSVAGWTHPRIRPADVVESPYFDGRAECLLWGTWSSVWAGMDLTAMQLLAGCQRAGVDPGRYGADVPAMAAVEGERRIWAVRLLLLHLLEGGLCLRPPRSLVEHIGFDEMATNAAGDARWTNPPLAPCPAIPERWPVAREAEGCAELWRRAFPPRASPAKSRGAWRARLRKLARRARFFG